MGTWVIRAEQTDTALSFSVSGYVKDENGNVIDSAAVELQSTGESTTTSADGSYSLTLSDGSYTLEASKAGYSNGTTDITVSGAALTNQNITLSQDAVSGYVANQNGQPIQNATVQVWGVDYSQLTPPAGTTKAEEASDTLEDAVNKTPTEWTDQLDENFNLVGTGGHFGSLDTEYVAVHHVTDWQSAGFFDQVVDNPDLEQPLLTVPAAEGESTTLALSVWDASQEEGFLGQDGVKEDLPGQPVSGEIVVENVFAGDEVVTDLTTEKTEIGAGGFVAATDYSNAYVTVDLTPGFYRVYPEGSPEASYLIKVGDPIEFIDSDLQDAGKQTVEQAKAVATDLTNNVLIRKTTTTDSDGFYSVNMSVDANKVQVQAYKADSLPDDVATASDLNVSDIVSEYRDTDDVSLDDLGSLYLPSATRRVSPPASNTNLTLMELSYPPYGDLEKLSDKLLDDLRDQLNETFTDRLGDIQQRLNATSSQELERIHSDLERLASENDALRDRVSDLLNQDRQSGEGELEVVINESDKTDAELRDRITTLSEAINQLQETIEAGEPERTVNEETVDLTFPFDGDLTDDGAALLVHYSNGTTKTFNTSDERVSVDQRIGRSDLLVVEDFPLGENDSAVASFEALVATDEGIGRSVERVVNPTFDNDVPALESIALTSLNPGPSDKVEVSVNPEDTAEFGELTGVTVFGPSGSERTTDAITDDGTTTGFTTNGAGLYHVELTFNNTAGDEFTETFRVRAGDIDRKRSPSVQPASGPTGEYVLVGDGLSGGDMNANADGSRVELTAEIASDQDVPGAVHFYTSTMQTAAETRYTLRVVRGESQKQVAKQVGVVLHGAALTSETPVLYREEDQPIPREGTNQYANVERRDNGTVIRSFTEPDGAVQLRTDDAPGLSERLIYRARLELGITSLSDLAGAVLPIRWQPREPAGGPRGIVLPVAVDLGRWFA